MRGVDARGGWAYTCPCGGNLFTFDGRLALPTSLVGYLAYQKLGAGSPLGVRKDIPHLEYYVGYSDFMDDVKRDAINQLKLAGSIPEDECQDERCKRNRTEWRAKLPEALEEDGYWRKVPDEQLAAHFRTPIARVRELKKRYSGES